MEQFFNALVDNFVPIFASTVGVLVIVLGRGLIKKYCDKLDIETKTRLDDMVTNITQQGVAFAEQWAKNRNKQLPESIKTQGDEKMHKAMEYVILH